MDSTYFLTPISLRSDVTDFSSYVDIFLSKFGLNVPDSAKKSKTIVTSFPSATGWAYVSIYNSSTCGATSPDVLGGMLSGTCINTDTDSSYLVDCAGEKINIYHYTATDCSSTYTTKSVSKGCQTGDEGSYDDWIIFNQFGAR